MSTTLDTPDDFTVKLLVSSTYGKRQKRFKCSVNDGAELVVDLMNGGLANFETTNGHYVAVGRDDLKGLIMFLMGHLFPDGNAQP